MTRALALATLVISGGAGFLVGELATRAQRTRDAGTLTRDAARVAGEQAALRQGYAEEQAALRRVATLVARGPAPEEVFAAVTAEVGRVLDVDHTSMMRFDQDGTATVVGAWTRTGAAGPVVVGSRVVLGGRNIGTLVSETGRSARIDQYVDTSGHADDLAREWGIGASVGVPIGVEGRPWGVMSAVCTSEQPLPADTESRLAGFTELVATAIANAQARLELREFAEEQAALRRVATLVARGPAPEEVFAAVAAEVGRVLDVDFTVMSRYDTDDAATVVGRWSRTGAAANTPVGNRVKHGGQNVHTLVFRTRAPARIDEYAGASGAAADVARDWGFRSAVGVPISVESRLWGMMSVAYTHQRAPGLVLPADTEARLARFTELVATAIANAESQAQLTASRARIVAAADAARRRIERDLHDGAQQRLVSMALRLRMAQAAAPPEASELAARLGELSTVATSALDELRELARGIHPAILAEGGLRPALKGLARRSAVPVELAVRIEGRLPEPIEIAVYYLVSEALTNAAKHAHASVVHVEVDAHARPSGDAVLGVCVRDDGRGGAALTSGSGLAGLKDRVEALGGGLGVQSARGAGTTVRAEFPLGPCAPAG